MKKDVVVLIGAGSIGLAIARRVSAGKHVVVADLSLDHAKEVANTLYNAGFASTAVQVDISSRKSILQVVKAAQELGQVKNLIVAAGVSPSQAPIEMILKVDLYGTSVILEEFGKIIAEGGSGVVISSQSGHRLTALPEEQNTQLATTPTEELLSLPMLQHGTVKNTLHAYQLSKRCNVLRVMAEAVKWGHRNARINSISPGIIITPLANDELTGPRGEGYRKMLDLSPAKRAGTPDEIGTLAHLLMSDDGAFISGSDFLIDGGTTASYHYGELAYLQKSF